jgi:hypothetical protein
MTRDLRQPDLVDHRPFLRRWSTYRRSLGKHAVTGPSHRCRPSRTLTSHIFSAGTAALAAAFVGLLVFGGTALGKAVRWGFNQG